MCIYAVGKWRAKPFQYVRRMLVLSTFYSSAPMILGFVDLIYS